MTVEVKLPNAIEQYVGPDGRLTLEGVKLIQRLVRAIEDHEARITALEP
ncbi:hypothetical protein [Sulfitobacter sp. 20_GPM-1509m]|nr:hypothetical protein [Sulfitobacter sp. 20_GPM-1509m]